MSEKEYGRHHYSEKNGTGDCSCGCWMGQSQSGGPPNIDPFGKCPCNPLKGERLEDNQDFEEVIRQRIAELQARVNQGEMEIRTLKARLAKVKPAKIKLADELEEAKTELEEFKKALQQIRDILLLALSK